MNECEVCGMFCEGDLCRDCLYRMTTNDVSDIRQRVADHCNVEYEQDQHLIAICQHFSITREQVFERGRKEPGLTAKHLFIYVLYENFHISQLKLGVRFGLNHSTICWLVKKYRKKFQSEFARKKFETILNIK